MKSRRGRKSHGASPNQPKASPDSTDEALTQGEQWGLVPLWKKVWELEHLASEGNRDAFNDLVTLLHQILDWLHFMAVLPDAAAGSLLRRKIPEEEAPLRYKRGEHVAAWAGIELAKIYKNFKAEIESQSPKAVHRLTRLLHGFRAGANLDFSPNVWFQQEYSTQNDYRPRGEMVVWFAQQIEGVRQLKVSRGWWAHIVPALSEKPKAKADLEFPGPLAASDLIKGEDWLKKLDELPPFGGSEKDTEDWHKFLRGRLRTHGGIMAEFDSLFPGQRKKFDGSFTATLQACWKGAGKGGQTIIR